MSSNLGYFLLISLLLVATSEAEVTAQAPGPVTYKQPTPAAPNAPISSPVIPHTPPPSPVKAYTPPPRVVAPPKAPLVAPYPPKTPVVAPPKASAPAPAPYYGSGPPLKKQECGPACTNRCKLHSRLNVCMRACTTCCERCKCVPPGTYGNRQVCGRCYTDMTTHGGKPKCP